MCRLALRLKIRTRLGNHGRKPTSKVLSKSCCAMAKPCAAEIARSFGLKDVAVLDQGHRVRLLQVPLLFWFFRLTFAPVFW